MLDPNLRFEVHDVQSDLSTVSGFIGPVSIDPVLKWLDQKGIVYFYCDWWQHSLHDVSEPDQSEAGWETMKTYRIRIFPAQIQFLKPGDYAMTKLRWHGVYQFKVSTQDGITLKGKF